MRLAATGIIIDNQKRILLLKRSNYTKAFPYHWSFPGGRGEKGETAEEIVIREVKEESGLGFIPTKLYEDYQAPHPGEKDVHVHRFLGNYSGKISIQEEEADGYAWYTYKETLELKMAFNYADVIEKLYKDGLL